MPSPLGLESGTVRVAPYDPEWPLMFQAEAHRLRRDLAPLPITLEHTGSTSVPGLASKPILDIAAGYVGGTPVQAYIERLVACGYAHRGEQGIPGREFFRRGEPRAYHVHLTRLDGTFWREHLAFRDYLRAHPASRDEYARLKYALAERFSRDRESYINGKTAFVRKVVAMSPDAPR
jgi:GrpB-like predicted nucleotidyltransferase (UPF0157 family)